MWERDPSYLNAEFIDQLKWLAAKETEARTATVVRMVNNRRDSHPDTYDMSALFYGTVLLNWIDDKRN